MTTNTQLHAQVTHELLARYSLPVSPTWLTTFLSNTTTNNTTSNAPNNQAISGPGAISISTLASNANSHLLSSDITTTLSTTPASTLPANTSDVTLKERRLPGTIVVQVLDIRDIGSSRWTQLEELERVEKREVIRGREVVRNLPDEDADAQGISSNSTSGRGPYVLVLQDAKGQNVSGLELSRVEKIGMGMGIGCKLVLMGVVVRRGMVMLTNATVRVLGGRVDVWDGKWNGERKQRLVRELEREEEKREDGEGVVR